MQEVKTKIATAATVAVLAGLTGVAMSSGEEDAGTASAEQQATRPKVVRRTIHVTKRADAAAAAATGAPAGFAGAATAGASPITSASGGFAGGPSAAPVS